MPLSIINQREPSRIRSASSGDEVDGNFDRTAKGTLSNQKCSEAHSTRAKRSSLDGILEP